MNKMTDSNEEGEMSKLRMLIDLCDIRLWSAGEDPDSWIQGWAAMSSGATELEVMLKKHPVAVQKMHQSNHHCEGSVEAQTSQTRHEAGSCSVR